MERGTIQDFRNVKFGSFMTSDSVTSTYINTVLVIPSHIVQLFMRVFSKKKHFHNLFYESPN